MRFLREILTDYDNQTYDTGRCIAVFLVASMTAFEGVAVWNGKSFDPQAFGLGMAAILGALGAAVAGDNHKRPDRE